MKKILLLVTSIFFLVACGGGQPNLDGMYEDGTDAINIKNDTAEIYFGKNDFYMNANIVYYEKEQAYGFTNASIDTNYPDEFILFGEVFAEAALFEPVIERNQVVAIDIHIPDASPTRLMKQK